MYEGAEGWRWRIRAGLTVVMQPAGGCGYGSVLKLWRPFRPMRQGSL